MSAPRERRLLAVVSSLDALDNGYGRDLDSLDPDMPLWLAVAKIRMTPLWTEFSYSLTIPAHLLVLTAKDKGGWPVEIRRCAGGFHLVVRTPKLQLVVPQGTEEDRRLILVRIPANAMRCRLRAPEYTVSNGNFYVSWDYEITETYNADPTILDVIDDIESQQQRLTSIYAQAHLFSQRPLG